MFTSCEGHKSWAKFLAHLRGISASMDQYVPKLRYKRKFRILYLSVGKVPVYLRNIIRDYFRDWVVFVQTASDKVRKEMTCGVPQGSVLEPLLWNIAFDDILKEEVPPGVNVICYTDDTLNMCRKLILPVG